LTWRLLLTACRIRAGTDETRTTASPRTVTALARRRVCVCLDVNRMIEIEMSDLAIALGFVVIAVLGIIALVLLDI